MDENYNEENPIILDYNTEREKLAMPEYGRNVLKMVEDVKRIEDRTKRSEQARAVVRVLSSARHWSHVLDSSAARNWYFSCLASW